MVKSRPNARCNGKVAAKWSEPWSVPRRKEPFPKGVVLADNADFEDKEEHVKAEDNTEEVNGELGNGEVDNEEVDTDKDLVGLVIELLLERELPQVISTLSVVNL